jgi:FkbM family methyltransferase
MLLLSRMSAKVYAFEPMPESWQIASERLDRNGIANVELLNFGLGTEDAEIPYYWDSTNSNRMAGSFVAEHARLAEFGRLRVRHGDAWARDAGVERVDLVKIDVEGFEAAVLLGLRVVLRAEPFILVEISWTAFDRISAEGGLESVLPFTFDLYRVCSAKNAFFFDFRGFELVPIPRIERPTGWGYNVIIVPRSRPRLSGLEKRIRR